MGQLFREVVVDRWRELVARWRQWAVSVPPEDV